MGLRTIDSHTEGEPTRLIVDGLPELPGSVHERLAALRDSFDGLRRTLCLEPRGSEIAIGAALFPPSQADCTGDLVFFNNSGYLGMCGHGTIGVVATLAWLGRIEPGVHRFNTVSGVVSTELLDSNRVRIENVPARRTARNVAVDIPAHGPITGDVAYGGNWFFLSSDHGQVIDQGNTRALLDFTSAVMDSLGSQGITGEDGAAIDHVELFGPPTREDADSKNFVLCPGKQFDRSPCGTGTSAKLACLYEDGRLAEGQTWRQESIIGSLFAGHIVVRDGILVPVIEGTAFVTAETTIIDDGLDPLRDGILL
ncbi:MAG: proline racemase family protein [Armatimonadetes bacterium]|nr:proline racemase family protein [Armatimonadota bacterium]